LGEARITATPEARQALLRAAAEHGSLMFHTSGGRVGGRTVPILLPIGSLRLGVRDHLLGTVEGVHIYEMEDRDGASRGQGASYILDVEKGPAIGFSIAAGLGQRFTLRKDKGVTNDTEEGCCDDT